MDHDLEPNEFRVVIPTESCNVVKFMQEGLPGVMLVNCALREFQPKHVFGWHLSVMIHLKDLVQNGMPSKQEQNLVEPFVDVLDSDFKGEDFHKPNALFLARITWNATQELIYRVHDPEPAHLALQLYIREKMYPRTLDYRIDPDPEWNLAEWHLGTSKD